MLEINKIYSGDAIEIMKEIDSNSIDAIITDPPYGLGMADWDKVINIEMLMIEFKQVLRPNGFLAFFAQMPTMIDWLNQANVPFQYKEHITWVKCITLPSKRLSRSHEEIFIYSKGNSTFYKTKGLYSDIKLAHLYFNIISIEGIKRYISDLQLGGTKRCTLSKSQSIYQRYKDMKSRERSPLFCNYTNTWSFLPPNQSERNGKYRHPTEKPTNVIERLIEMLSVKNMLILDPFIGSGTTAIACIRTKRNYIGIDISEEYCNIANERIKTEMQQLKLDI